MNSILLAGASVVLGTGVIGALHHHSLLDHDANTSKKPFALVAHVEPVDKDADKLLDALIHSCRAAEGQPGHLQYQVIRPQGAKGPITVISTWEDEDAWEAFTKTEVFRDIHDPELMRRFHEWLKKITHSECEIVASWQPPSEKQRGPLETWQHGR